MQANLKKAPRRRVLETMRWGEKNGGTKKECLRQRSKRGEHRNGMRQLDPGGGSLHARHEGSDPQLKKKKGWGGRNPSTVEQEKEQKPSWPLSWVRTIKEREG